MATIDGLGPGRPLRAASRPGAPPGATGFAVPGGAAATDPAAGGAAMGTPVGSASALGGIDALLLLQEAPDPAARDRRARRRAHDLLQALAGLQRALLADGEAGIVQQLESLLHDVPLAADPVLADLAAAVTLRARVELARRGR